MVPLSGVVFTSWLHIVYSSSHLKTDLTSFVWRHYKKAWWITSPESLIGSSLSRGGGLSCHLCSSDGSRCSVIQGGLQPLDGRSLSCGATAAAWGKQFHHMLQSDTEDKGSAAADRGWEFCFTCMWKQKKNTVIDTAGLTHSTQRTDSSIVLSWQVLLVAHRAHAISPRVTIETTAGGTEHGNWALIGLLGHSDVCRLVSWPVDTNKRRTLEWWMFVWVQPIYRETWPEKW